MSFVTKWEKVVHVPIESKSADSVEIKLNPTDADLPRVTIITIVNKDDYALFAASLHSWNSLAYPNNLLNWVVVDNYGCIDKLVGDDRVRIIRPGKDKSRNQIVNHVMDMEWAYSIEHPDPANTKPARDRHHNFTFMECGDVMYPDNLSIKFRALMQFSREAVIANSLANYIIPRNLSIVTKFYQRMPYSGMYWMKKWWGMKRSDKLVAVPYIGNCITLGPCSLNGQSIRSSIRFFDSFPSEIKEFIESIHKAVREKLRTQ